MTDGLTEVFRSSFVIVLRRPTWLIVPQTLSFVKLVNSWFRDPLRSTVNHVSKSLGIRWICLAILVPVPWSQRLWALPFMTIPALGPKTSDKLKKRIERLSIGP